MFNCGLKIHIVRILQSQLKLSNNTKGVPVDSNNTHPYSEIDKDPDIMMPIVVTLWWLIAIPPLSKQPRNTLFFQNYQFVSRVCEQWKPYENAIVSEVLKQLYN